MYHLKKKYYLLIMLALFLISTGNIFSQWVSQNTGSNYPVFAVYFIDDQTGFAGTNSDNIPAFVGGEIYRTSNGGSNWQRVLLDSNLRVASFYFINSATGYAVGGSYSFRASVFKTTDSGLNWFETTPPALLSHLYNILYLNTSTGFLGGTYGVFKTTNSGGSWVKVLDQPQNLNLSWSKVVFPENNTGYYLADSGNVYKSTDSGTNWQLVRSGGSLFFDIKFLNVNTGFISGQTGILSKTTDAGATWNTFNTGIAGSSYSLFFNDINTGYASGYQFTVKTTNSGITWFPVISSQSNSYYSVYFLDSDTGYLGSDSGKVYKTTSGSVLGINNIFGEVPKEYSLNQNYPNPFNPTTNIRFSIPKSAFVRLAVYDMLGKEVESLVNGQLTPGTYEVSWNALKYSSGIYMYRLVTNDIQMVKKMSLVK